VIVTSLQNARVKQIRALRTRKERERTGLFFVDGLHLVVEAIRTGAPDRLGWIALAGTQYPGNLGTIVRTADAVRADGVLLLDATADPYDPIAVRATAGAIFSTAIARASFAAFLAWARARSLPIVGTAPDAPTDYRSVRYRTPLILLMGREGQGLPREHRELCDTVVRIPMRGRCDSLNLAVATGVLLYEVFEQWRRDRPDGSHEPRSHRL